MRVPMLVVLGLSALVGCTAAPTGKAPVAPDRTVMAQAAVKAPTLDQLERLVPTKLAPAQARKVLIRVGPGQVRLPGGARKTSFLVASVPSIYGLYPFSYLGLSYYAPFTWDVGLGAYSALYASPLVSMYPYLASPFSYVGALGCYAPYGYWPSYGGLII